MIANFFDSFIRYILGSNDFSQKRDGYIDSVKFFLILLMVFGHVLNYSLYGYNQAIHNFIYTFHMPLFIFLSGFFSKSSNLQKVLKQVLFLILTTFLFQLLYRRTIDLEFWIKPFWILWYIYSLAIWKLLIYFVFSRLNPKVSLCLSVFGGVIVGFFPVGYEFSLSRIFVFLPYMVIGYYFTKDNLKSLHKINLLLSYVIFFIILICFIFYKDTSFLSVLKGAFPYSETDFGVYGALKYRIIFYVVSILIGICVLRIIPVFPKYFRLLGQNSLFIYLVHIAILLLLDKYHFFSLDIVSNIFVAFVCSCIIILIVDFLRRLLLVLYNKLSIC